MIKPILVIKVGAKNASREEVLNSSKTLERKLDRISRDYHILIIPVWNTSEVDVEVFFEKDFTRIKYGELKELVENLLTCQYEKN